MTETALDWTDLDRRAVDNARVLAMDAVQAAGSGHPGTAMSLAPVAYLLYHKLMRLDPSDSRWPGRDRFVLSCGHTSLTQYVQLYLSGYDLPLEQLEQYRKWGSLTPGHPEVEHTDGIEVTTGPLGQGLANAVGMAMSARRERGLLDPDAGPGQGVFDHTVWVIASDGDIEEGVTSEASSLAGVQQLGNLVVIYDQNRISIEDDTADRARRGHGEAVRGLRLACADRGLDGRRGPDVRQGRQLPRGRPGAVRRARRRARRDVAPVLHRPEDRPGVAGAERAEHRQGARLGARRGRGPQPPSRCSASTPTSTSRSTSRPWPGPARSSTRGGSCTPSGTSASPSGRPTTRTGSSSGTGCASGGSRRGGRTSCRPSRRARPWRRARRAAMRSTRSRTSCRSCGAARRTSPRATTRPWRASRRSCPPRSRRSCGARATPTGASCTSASASTPWARS